MKSKWLAGLSLGLIAVFGTSYVAAEEKDKEFKSGLQPGESTKTFLCRDITGPNKGKSLCYV